MLPGAPRRAPHNDMGLLTWASKYIHAGMYSDAQFSQHLCSTAAQQLGPLSQFTSEAIAYSQAYRVV